MNPENKIIQEIKINRNTNNLVLNQDKEKKKEAEKSMSYYVDNEAYINELTTFELFSKYFKYRFSNDENADVDSIWTDYCSCLLHVNTFYNSFKSLFCILNLIRTNGYLSDSLKKEYLSVVQAQLSLDELFCYLINQMYYYKDNGMEKEDYPKFLREYDFFIDLSRDCVYGNILNDSRFSQYRQHFVKS